MPFLIRLMCLLAGLAGSFAAEAQIARPPNCSPEATGISADGKTECVVTPSGSSVLILRGSAPAPVKATPISAPDRSQLENGVSIVRPPVPVRPQTALEPDLPRVTLDPSCFRQVVPVRRQLIQAGILPTRYKVCYGDLVLRSDFQTIDLFERIQDAAARACRKPKAEGFLAAFPEGAPRRNACAVQTVEDVIRDSRIGFLQGFLREDVDQRVVVLRPLRID
ncbi:MAG: hypothetical protein AAFQ67_04940 [Pseudomonadota bacterium]